MGLIPGSPGGGYSCLESPMDTGAWQAIVHRVAKSHTQLKQLSTAQHSTSLKAATAAAKTLPTMDFFLQEELYIF